MPDGIRMSSNAAAVAAGLAAMPAQVDAGLGTLTAKYGALLLTRVRGNASGRPGPRRQTGDYRRSWSQQTYRSAPGVWTAVVGTNAPQGRRLELGFVGVDSLGRHYSQPPYPHAYPALDRTVPEYRAAAVELVAALGRGDVGALDVRGRGPFTQE